MKLFLLNLRKDYSNNSSALANTYYDMVLGFVVRAENEEAARQIASDNHEDEGDQVWFDRSKVTCEEIHVSGDAGMILKDSING